MNIAAERAPLIVELITSWQAAGSERVAQRLCAAFLERGYRVACVSLYEEHGPVRSELETLGIPCYALSLERRRRIRKLQMQWEVYRLLRQLKAHAVHAHHVPNLLWVGIPARLAGVENFVLTEHTDFELRRSFTLRLRTLLQVRSATLTTGIHGELVSYLRRALLLPASRVRLIPNGIDMRRAPPSRSQARAALAIPSDESIVVFVGRLHDHKDPETLIRAFAVTVQQVAGPLRLFMVGAGDNLRFRRLAEDLCISERVVFVGEVGDVSPYLASADVFVMSSVTEGAPLALLEAMSVGLPCLATRVGGIPELLADGAGLLVEPRQPTAMSSELTRLLHDHDLRQRLSGSACQRVLERYSFDRIVDQYLSAFRLPLDARQVSPRPLGA